MVVQVLLSCGCTGGAWLFQRQPEFHNRGASLWLIAATPSSYIIQRWRGAARSYIQKQWATHLKVLTTDSEKSVCKRHTVHYMREAYSALENICLTAVVAVDVAPG